MIDQIIHLAHNLLIREFDLYIKIGVEIEFYINDLNIQNHLFYKIVEESKSKAVNLSTFRKEKGVNQFEFDIEFDYPIKLNKHISILKKILISNNILMAAKPYLDQPGNAMHFNISLHDSSGTNVYIKKNEFINKFLSYSIGGLLELSNQSMIFFAPNIESYYRFDNSFDVPQKICWGGNNRTTALRVLKNTEDNIRIEHRIAGVDCNDYLSITAIILAIYHGIKNKIEAPNQIYGNAFDKKYSLLDLSSSLEESIKYFNSDQILQKYLNNLGYHIKY